ncbi:hypothetical protein ACWF2L_21590 [Streptomyces anulatus]
MIAAQAIDEQRGTLLVSTDKAAVYDHMMAMLKSIGVPKISESNFNEVWARVAMWGRSHEITREDEEGDERETSFLEVRSHLNLANPDAVAKTRTRFETEVIGSMRTIANEQCFKRVYA